MGIPGESPKISRRAFLKIAAAAAGGLALAAYLPQYGIVSIRAAGIEKLYRGTLDGQILESLDRGQSWDTITRFGREFAVLGMSIHPAGMAAWMLFQGRTFTLKSADGRAWYTADWQAPA